MKRFLSMILIGCMVMLMTSAAMAEAAPAPSIEDILNDYHAKAFAAQNGGAGNASRSGSGMTPEQEAVEELAEAGYTAYNVTADNYDALQESLNTDFSELGLDPEGSYIIVISGEDDTNSGNPNSRFNNLPSYDMIDPGDGESFLYIYKDRHYTMRYVTVAGGESFREKEIDITSSFTADFSVEFLLFSILRLYSAVNNAIEGFVNQDVGSIASIFGIDTTHTYEIKDEGLKLEVTAEWTHKYVQILNEKTNHWDAAARAEYAYVTENLHGSLYDCFTGISTDYDETKNSIVYSHYYNNASYLKEKAASYYYSGSFYVNRTGNIDIFLTKPDKSSVCILTVYEGI